MDDDDVAKEKESRYTDSPDSLEETNTDLFDSIVSSISSKQKRRDYARLAPTGGIELLVLLAKEINLFIAESFLSLRVTQESGAATTTPLDAVAPAPTPTPPAERDPSPTAAAPPDAL